MPPPPHSSAVIISSGDELLTGQLLDTNAHYLADALTSRGVLPAQFITVPDDLPQIVAALRRACEQAPLVIISGGLGPTDGDLTRQALAQLAGDTLIPDEHAKAAITAMLTKRGREVSDRQLRQAMRPSRAACLANTVGTAPGLFVRVPPSDLFALPGPPGELRPMFESHVAPLLRPDPAHTVTTRLLHVIGLPEAECVQRLGDLTKRDRNPLVGITASAGILTIRIRHKARATTSALRQGGADALDATESAIRAELNDHILPRTPDSPPTGPEQLAQHILNHLRAARHTLATVESCTGGMLGEMLTAIPGSSAAYLGGHITYANALKEQLGVNATTLTAHGAVSPETAREMAAAGLARTGADLCLSITGIAGPDGGSPAKPVGTVHIALAHQSRKAQAPAANHSRHFLFPGDREDIRRRAAISALSTLYFHLSGRPAGEPRLLWEVAPPRSARGPAA